MQPFIALTDHNWFKFLCNRSADGIVDEVNFWQPKARRPMRKMVPGEPVFFRLKAPFHAIVGYGFFAHFQVVAVEEAWNIFDWRNGADTMVSFLERISSYRNEDLSIAENRRKPLGCTILRDAHFWPHYRWLEWANNEGWKPNIVQGKTERDPVRAQKLIATISDDHAATPRDLLSDFVAVEVDQRTVIERPTVQREGQGAFRLRLLDAYGQCAITGEHTLPVLDAAHIQPYLGPASNHPQNGLILTKEFHTLFDQGYITVTPDYDVHVSEALRADYNNGRRYYGYDGQKINIPSIPAARPSRDALAWHTEQVYRG